jgi:hypothetical protein
LQWLTLGSCFLLFHTIFPFTVRHQRLRCAA